MIPDNVEKIIMAKEDYDRNVEQLLFDKCNAELEVERLSVELNQCMIERNDYLSRNEKAIEYIEKLPYKDLIPLEIKVIEKILKGSDKENEE